MMHELGMPHHMGFGLGAATDDELGALAARRGRGRARSPKRLLACIIAYIKFCTVCS